MMERAKKSKSGIQKLPQEILFNILARLPVKLLIKCKTTCKLWFNIISNPHFVDFQIQQSTSKLRLFRYDCKNHEYQLWSFNFKEMSNIKAKKVASLQHSQFYSGEYYTINSYASCDDLILIRGVSYDIENKRLWVFNSISHKLKSLPTMPNSANCNRFDRFEYLLVHDAAIQKYKVLVLCFARFLERCCIFTLDENDEISINGAMESWRVLSCLPLKKIRRRPLGFSSVSVNGMLYWIAEEDRMVLIESLDIAREEFMHSIKPPCQPMEIYITGNYRLLAIKGSLCLMNPASAQELDIWVSKDYGVSREYEWTMQYKITLESMVCKPVSLKSLFSSIFKPVLVIESCSSSLIYIFIRLDFKLFCYNIESRELRQVAIEGQDSNSLFAYPCIIGAC